MPPNPPTRLRTINRLRALAIVSLLILLVPLSLLAAPPVGVLRAEASVLRLAAEHPLDPMHIIVQKGVSDARVEQLVARLGGVVTKDLRIINGFAADVQASVVPTLARADGVRWVSLDTPLLKSACSDCVDTTRAVSSWLQTTQLTELWKQQPQLQGQGVTVAVLDSGITDHQDLRNADGSTRLVTNISYVGVQLENAGFERGMDAWQQGPGTAGFTPNAHSGSNALQLSQGSEITQGISNFVPGATYVLSGWGKLNAAGKSGVIGVRGTNGVSWKSALQFSEGAWTYKELTFTIPAGTTWVEVYIWNVDSPAFSADDLKITAEQVYTGVPITNAGFESGLIGWNSWNGPAGTTSDAKSGAKAAQLPNSVGLIQNILNFTPGTTYTVAGWGKVSNGGQGSIAIKGLTRAGTTWDFPVVFTETAYAYKELSVIVPADATSMQLYSRSLTGTFIIDDLKIVASSTSGASNPANGYKSRSAFTIIEAESFDGMSGLTKWTGIGSLDNGDWAQYNNVDFGAGITSFQARVAVPDQFAKQQLEVRLDSPSGQLLATLRVNSTKSWDTYTTQSIFTSGVTGVHTVFLVAKGNGVANVDWFSFARAGDEYGHGTHVAGIIAGNGNASGGAVVGIAPGVNLVNVRVNDVNGAATAADIISGLEWINENRATYNIRVVNISLNSSTAESYHSSALNAAVEILWFNGVVVVVSAGNNGPGGNIYPPANDPFVITVGATDDKGTPSRSDDVLAKFSASGKTEDGFAKPEIVAPGVNITSLQCSTCTMNQAHKNNVASGFAGAENYFVASGTSMAAPMVAGAAALMLQQNPALTPDQVKYRLMSTGSPFGIGTSYLNIVQAVQSTSTASANTGIPASQSLWTGSEPVTWNSVKWNSVKWNSVKWNSVNWNSAVMNASSNNSVSPSVYFDR